jgi:16S rRNA (guanine527-N7)-methyltransferase
VSKEARDVRVEVEPSKFISVKDLWPTKTIGVKNKEKIEEIKKQQFDFVVTRAVATLDKIVPWTQSKISTKHINPLPNGLIALKGMNNIKEEIRNAGRGIYADITPISEYFEEEFFEEKCIVYAQY